MAQKTSCSHERIRSEIYIIDKLWQFGVRQYPRRSQFTPIYQVKFNDNNNILTCSVNNNNERCSVMSVLISQGMISARWLNHLWFIDSSGTETKFISYIKQKYPELNLK